MHNKLQVDLLKSFTFIFENQSSRPLYLSMRLVFFFHFSIFLALGLGSLLRESGRNKYQRNKHILAVDEMFPNDHKKIKSVEQDLKTIIEMNNSDRFVEYMHENVVDLAHGTCLEYCVRNDKITILKIYFKTTVQIYQIDVFDALFHTIKVASSLKKYEIIKILAKHKFIGNEEKEETLLRWILTTNNLKVLKICLDNGIDFESWTTRRGQTLSHVVVQKNWLKVADSMTDFQKVDKSGFTPIFYATSVEMVQLIRSKCPGARETIGKYGKTAWQIALHSKNDLLLDAMISPARRFKKFRGKQLDYFDFDWVRSASLFEINRDTIVKDSYKQIQKDKYRWYKPRHKFFIKFIGERGLDAGGLKIDWMTNLLNKFFLQSLLGKVKDFTAPIFKLVEEEGSLYAPNTAYKPEIFRFVGSIIGVALAMNVPLQQKFIPSVYKALMHEDLNLEADLQEQSLTTYTSLQALYGPTIRLSELELTRPSNAFAHVTRRNLPTYIREYSRDVLIGRYQKHVSELVAGFESVHAAKARIDLFFKLDEFKRHLTGKPADYTADEFMDNCNCTNEAVKGALRRLIGEMTPAQRVSLLKFATGFDSLPAAGFAGFANKLTVLIDSRLVGKFPTSSTCIPVLIVAPFVDYEAFSRSLLTAIEYTTNVDNEAGITSESDGIVLEFDSDHELEAVALESESEVEFSLDETESDSDNDS